MLAGVLLGVGGAGAIVAGYAATTGLIDVGVSLFIVGGLLAGLSETLHPVLDPNETTRASSVPVPESPRGRPDDRPASVRIVEAVAAHDRMVEPADLSPPLGRIVDGDALDSLFAEMAETPGGEATVAFVYQGYRIRARSDESVDVRAVDRPR